MSTPTFSISGLGDIIEDLKKSIREPGRLDPKGILEMLNSVPTRWGEIDADLWRFLLNRIQKEQGTGIPSPAYEGIRNIIKDELTHDK
jgi:hypothetical protein